MPPPISKRTDTPCPYTTRFRSPDAGAADPSRLVAGARRRVDRAWTAIVAVAWRDGGIRHGDLVRADFLCAARAVRTDCARAVDGGGVAARRAAGAAGAVAVRIRGAVDWIELRSAHPLCRSDERRVGKGWVRWG